MTTHHVTHKEWLQAGDNGLETTSYGFDTLYGRETAWVVLTGHTEDKIKRIERDMERCMEELCVALQNIESNKDFQTKHTDTEGHKHFDVEGTKKQLKAHQSEKSYWTKKLSDKDVELKKLQSRLRAEAKFLNDLDVKEESN